MFHMLRINQGEILLYIVCAGLLVMFLGHSNPGTVPLSKVGEIGRREYLDTREDKEFAGKDVPQVITTVKEFKLNHVYTVSNFTTIAIGCAIATRGKLKGVTQEELQVLPFYKSLLPSFCLTASEVFHYHFYIAYDYDDPFFSKEGGLEKFYKEFFRMTQVHCIRRNIITSIHFVKCSHSHHPAWAQNDAMMEAYFDNMEFYYRINDDTVMRTPMWTERFIQTLNGYDPPLIGVAGPSYLRRRKAILTYDFVHKTHIEIFGFYYPRTFGDWYADRWITKVYEPGRNRKLGDVKLIHTLSVGTRYRAHRAKGKQVAPRLSTDKETLERFINYKKKPFTKISKDKKIISLSLYGDNPKYIYGAVRNAQLRPIYFPGWKLRVYIEKKRPNGSTKYNKVPEKIITKLIQLGTEIKYIETDVINVPPMMWRFLVADDMEVNYFIVRDADSRFSDREVSTIRDWIASGKPFHCVRDHPSHGRFAISGGLWGGRPKELKLVFKKSFQEMMLGFGARYLQDMNFLNRRIWPNVKNYTLCHDSVSCNKWTGSRPFPVVRNGTEHLGQVFDAYGQPRIRDMAILKRKLPNLSNHCT